MVGRRGESSDADVNNRREGTEFKGRAPLSSKELQDDDNHCHA
jgi:hypothetical protein